MNIVTTKYRGTPMHAAVLRALHAAAASHSYVPYEDIARIMRLPSSGDHTSRELGIMLGEISEDEVDAGRPMLSAIAIGAAGKPGIGFYTLAHELRLLQRGDDEHLFWEQQRDAVYASRSGPNPPS